MPESDIIPPRGLPQTQETSNIIPARGDQPIQNQENPDIVPAQNEKNLGERGGATIDATKQKKAPFEPKMTRTQFFMGFCAVFLFFDFFPFCLIALDLTLVGAGIAEPLKWFINPIAWFSIGFLARLLGVTIFNTESMSTILRSAGKALFLPLTEFIPILNSFSPAWTLQYILTFAPVTFDIQELIKHGGTFAKIISWIPGLGLEVKAALKAAEIAATVATKK